MKKYLAAIVLSLMIVPFQSCFSQRKDAENVGNIGRINGENDLLIEGKKFEEAVTLLDVTDATEENSNINRYVVKGAVVFRNCEFQKPFLASIKKSGESYYTTFGRQVFFDSCYFWGDVDFRGAIIQGVLNFRNCIFYGNANFEEIECTSNAWFANCFFKKEVRFQNAFFNRKANFFNATFDSICSFQSAFFNQDAQFSNSKFWKYTDFSLCTFNMGAFFNYSTFFERSLFNNSDLRGRAEFVHAVFRKNVEMKACQFSGAVKFNKAEFYESVDISESSFMHGKPDIPTLSNTTVITKEASYIHLETL